MMTMEEITGATPGSLPWDFEVAKRQMVLADGQPTERFAITRKDSGHILGYSTGQYQPISYQKLISPILGWLENNTGNVSVRFAQKGEGQHASWEVLFGDDYPIKEGILGQAVRRSIVVQSSHDLSRGVWTNGSWHNLACLNGMVTPGAEFKIHSRHSGAFDETVYAEQVNVMLEALAADDDNAIEEWRNWAETTACQTSFYDIYKEVKATKGTTYTAKYKQQAAVRMLQLAGEGADYWQTLNALTDRHMDKMDDSFAMIKASARSMNIIRAEFENIAGSDEAATFVDEG